MTIEIGPKIGQGITKAEKGGGLVREPQSNIEDFDFGNPTRKEMNVHGHLAEGADEEDAAAAHAKANKKSTAKKESEPEKEAREAWAAAAWIARGIKYAFGAIFAYGAIQALMLGTFAAFLPAALPMAIVWVGGGQVLDIIFSMLAGKPLSPFRNMLFPISNLLFWGIHKLVKAKGEKKPEASAEPTGH